MKERLSFEREMQDLGLWEHDTNQYKVAREVVPRSTDPKDWFLTESEISKVRGNGEGGRRNLSVFTSKNLVIPLVDGEEMMKALRNDIGSDAEGRFHSFYWMAHGP